MVRHEDYSKQNQNKVPELREDVTICVFYIWPYLTISVEGKLLLQMKRQSKTCTGGLGRGSGCHQW